MTALELAARVAARVPSLRLWLASGRTSEAEAIARLRGLRNSLREAEIMALRGIALQADARAPAAAPTPAPSTPPDLPPVPVAPPAPPASFRLRDQVVEVHIGPSALFPRVTDLCRMRRGRFRRLRGVAWWDVAVVDVDDLVADLAAIGVVPDGLPHVRAILAGRAAELAQRVLTTSDATLAVPAGIDLYQHQDAGIRFLLARDRCLLADDQGLGKTLQTLIAVNTIGPGKRWLVLAPKTLVQNWYREAAKWVPKLSASMAKGGAAAADTCLVFCSIDSAKVAGGALQQSLLERRWDGLVVDEAHLVAKTTSLRWKLAKAVAARADRTWLLTGTPMQNRPMDLYGLLKLTRHELGADQHRFGLRYCDGKYGGFGWDYSGASNTAELAERLSAWVLRRTKDEVLDLPPKIRSEMWCDVPRAMATLRPRQIDALMRDRAALAKAKIAATWDRITSALDGGEKVLVFSEYLAVIAELRGLAVAASVGVVHVDGSVTGNARAEAVARFQSDPTCRLFIGQTVAAGVGITLTAATQVVFNDLCLVPAYHAQAEDRAYRIGTTQRIVVTYVLAESLLDQALWALLASKITLIRSWEGGLLDADAATASLANALMAKLGS